MFAIPLIHTLTGSAAGISVMVSENFKEKKQILTEDEDDFKFMDDSGIPAYWECDEKGNPHPILDRKKWPL